MRTDGRRLLWWASAWSMCMMAAGASNNASSAKGFYEQSSPRANNNVYLFDLSYTAGFTPEAAYEETLFVSAICGLANRAQATLYVKYLPADDHWLSYMQDRPFFRGVQVTELHNLSAVFDHFSPSFRGAVVYDTAVSSTSNVASTAAGAMDLLPVAFRPLDPGSLYSRFIGAERLQVVVDLVGRFNGSRSGSAKCDAYLWAIDEFVKGVNEVTVLPSGAMRASRNASEQLMSRMVDPQYLAYFVDHFWTKVPRGSGVQGDAPSYDLNTVANHDYFIANRAFFFDLNVWDDETPNDDPHQPLGTDLKTLITLLKAYYDLSGGKQMITVGGFTPWKFKYVGWKHDGVETEWMTARIMSSYNMLIDADACCINAMANAAFFQHYPLPERLTQQRAPTPKDLIDRGLLTVDEATGQYHVPEAGYYSFYVGDYDSSAWLYSQLYDKWADPARGTVPLGWALNPNLSKRFPLVFELVYESLTPMDRITTGDSGPGYVNPTELFEPRWSGLPDASDIWRKWCIEHYVRFGITATGFLLQGMAGSMTHQTQQFYNEFSADGYVNHYGYSPDFPKVPALEVNTPAFELKDLPGGDIAGSVAAMLQRYYQSGSGHQFFVFRTVLQTPSFHKQVVDGVSLADHRLKAVEPLTLSYLSRIHLGGHNNDRVQYIDDTLPRRVKAGDTVPAVFTVRNNGWNTLRLVAGGSERVTLVGSVGGMAFVAEGAEDVEPGQDGLLKGNVHVPVEQGEHRLEYGLVRDGGQGGRQAFSALGNPMYGVKVVVVGESSTGFLRASRTV